MLASIIELFSEALMTIMPIMVEEFIFFTDRNQYIDRSEFFTTEQASKLVKDLRHQSLKIKSSVSTKAKETINKMGINFDCSIYDLQIIVDQNKNLHNINFENLVLDHENNLPTYESLLGIMNAALELFFPMFGLNFEEYLKNLEFNDLHTKNANKFEEDYRLEKFIYSSSLLFNNSLSNQLTNKDKMFILFNYRAIQSCLIFPELIISSIIAGSNEINPNDTLYKYIAINIEKIGQELQKMETTFAKELLHEINKYITDKNFFPLNRKLRNNLHYQEIEKFSSKEMDSIRKFQLVYINTCLDYINSYINISLSEEVRSMTDYVNLALEEGILYDDLLANHEYYYTTFIMTGTIKKINLKRDK